MLDNGEVISTPETSHYKKHTDAVEHWYYNAI